MRTFYHSAWRLPALGAGAGAARLGPFQTARARILASGIGALGDPQWSAPCGGTLTTPANPPAPSRKSRAVRSFTSESGKWLSILAFTAWPSP